MVEATIISRTFARFKTGVQEAYSSSRSILSASALGAFRIFVRSK